MTKAKLEALAAEMLSDASDAMNGEWAACAYNYQQKLTAILAEFDERDGERYRWLRNEGVKLPVGDVTGWIADDDLDTAIDTAIAAARESEK